MILNNNYLMYEVIPLGNNKISWYAVDRQDLQSRPAVSTVIILTTNDKILLDKHTE